MPAYSTHYIFAKELIPMIKEIADFEVNENAVCIGSQGPDIFFFHRALPWQKGSTLKSAGTALHKAKCGDILDGFRYYLDVCDNLDIAKSYIYGFILHYALDRTCHPFVYALQDTITKRYPQENPSSVHNTIEFSIDSVMLNDRFGITDTKHFKNEDTLIFDEIEKAVIGEVLASVSRVVAPNSFAPIDVEIAIEDTKSSLAIMSGFNDNRENLIHGIEELASPLIKNFKLSSMIRTNNLENAKKCVNISKGYWTSPYETDRKRNESFFELFESAKIDAMTMINDFQNGKSGTEITKNISFLTGVEV